MTTSVVRNDSESRFEAIVDGCLCVLAYRLHDGVLGIDHVIVPDAVGGRGIAADLTRAALDAARANGWRVVPNCTYAAAWIERHPHYKDLLNRA